MGVATERSRASNCGNYCGYSGSGGSGKIMKGRAVVEFLLPSIVAWWRNRQLMREYKEKDPSKVAKSWEEKLKEGGTEDLQPIVDDVYDTEMQRKDALESKATSLFEGIGFAVSILSIAIVFIGQRLIFVLLLFPVFHFLIAGICSWNATRVAKYHFFTTSQDLENDLALTAGKPLEERRRYWIAQKLASTEMNSKLLLVKSNWLSAAYQHFVLGLLFIIPILAAMVYEIAQGLMYTDC
jgi:hypothetical protein